MFIAAEFPPQLFAVAEFPPQLFTAAEFPPQLFTAAEEVPPQQYTAAEEVSPQQYTAAEVRRTRKMVNYSRAGNNSSAGFIPQRINFQLQLHGRGQRELM